MGYSHKTGGRSSKAPRTESLRAGFPTQRIIKREGLLAKFGSGFHHLGYSELRGQYRPLSEKKHTSPLTGAQLVALTLFGDGRSLAYPPHAVLTAHLDSHPANATPLLCCPRFITVCSLQHPRADPQKCKCRSQVSKYPPRHMQTRALHPTQKS